MAKSATDQDIHSNLWKHVAVKAWSQFRGANTPPTDIQTLKERKGGQAGKSAVYRLVAAGPHGSSIIAKRCYRETGLLEQVIYERILPAVPIPKLEYYGYLEELEGEYSWLFIGDAGSKAFSPSNPAHCAAAGRWLGILHATTSMIPATDWLPYRGPGHYLESMLWTIDLIQTNWMNPHLVSDDREVLKRLLVSLEYLVSTWKEFSELADSIPSALVHGDFVEKNIRLQGNGLSVDLLAFDWEIAGWGAPVADLAQAQPGSERFSANPVAQAYWSVVREAWPDVRLDLLERLTHVGTIFRWIAAISWIVPGLAYDWTERTMDYLASYEPRLASELRAARWRV